MGKDKDTEAVVLQVVATETLKELMDKAQQSHTHVKRMGKRNLRRARDTGLLLVRAKAKCKHGKWLRILSKFGIPPTTANSYMQIAENWDMVRDTANITEALDRIASDELIVPDWGNLKLPEPICFLL